MIAVSSTVPLVEDPNVGCVGAKMIVHSSRDGASATLEQVQLTITNTDYHLEAQQNPSRLVS